MDATTATVLKDIAEARDALARAEASIATATTAQEAVARNVAVAIEDAAPAPRREPRGGHKRAKLARDPEVRQFVEARLNTWDYGDIAAATLAAFGPDRAVSRSSVHRWWKKKFAPPKYSPPPPNEPHTREIPRNSG